jgi:phosphoenolpyruvate carboxylase
MNINTKFENNISIKYQIYNSLFLTLPFEQVSNTGVLLPLLTRDCQKGFDRQKDPKQIIEQFFDKHSGFKSEKEKITFLFKCIQYIERQVVLFDAVEDAAFEKVHNFNGNGTIPYVFNRANTQQSKDELVKKLNDFKARIVLTAHPTQFYPGRVLSIISELEDAIRETQLEKINELLQQLGRTAFVSDDKPTPFDEATSLMWYLENVFYHSVAKVHSRLRHELAKIGVDDFKKDIINIGFWPCGDRDGNPFVNAEITLKTARQLRHKIFICYFRDAKKLRQRMTFSGVDLLAENIYSKISATIFNTKGERYKSKDQILIDLNEIRDLVNSKHNGLFVEVVEDFIVKVNLFGFHFTHLDIRQDSRIHTHVLDQVFEAHHQGHLNDSIQGEIPKNYSQLPEAEKIQVLLNIHGQVDSNIFEEEIVSETIKSFHAIQQIQNENGEKGCHRYIISNTQSTLNIIEVYALARLCGWQKDSMTFDIVPLLETIEDLANGESILNTLYNIPEYSEHLKARNNHQNIMLGFSDGTKDGGYLKANWGIFKAKEILSSVSKKNDIKVIFFDGRGGPPARGGGNTNKFYSSLGDQIENHEIQLTIQGQTISSNFGTLNSSQYNLEQFFCAGVENTVFKRDRSNLNDKQRNIMEDLSETAYQSYMDFKNHPVFIDYLEDVSVLKYYGLTNIGSRPSKRESNRKLNLSDLRAIPFVGAWTQMKQNVPGFYGLGTAIKNYEDEGRIDEIKDFYKSSLFFRTLIDNSMQALCKSYFPLTSYLQKDEKFGKFWHNIHDEYQLSKRLLLKISGQKQLLETSPNTRSSIDIRENIILPLITIQQYALMKVKAMEKGEIVDDDLKEVYEKIIIRAFFGSINASRNAA